MILIPQSNSDICELNEAERCYAADQQCNCSVLSQSYHTTAWKYVFQGTVFDLSSKVCDTKQPKIVTYCLSVASLLQRWEENSN